MLERCALSNYISFIKFQPMQHKKIIRNIGLNVSCALKNNSIHNPESKLFSTYFFLCRIYYFIFKLSFKYILKHTFFKKHLFSFKQLSSFHDLKNRAYKSTKPIDAIGVIFLFLFAFLK